MNLFENLQIFYEVDEPKQLSLFDNEKEQLPNNQSKSKNTKTIPFNLDFNIEFTELSESTSCIIFTISDKNCKCKYTIRVINTYPTKEESDYLKLVNLLNELNKKKLSHVGRDKVEILNDVIRVIKNHIPKNSKSNNDSNIVFIGELYGKISNENENDIENYLKSVYKNFDKLLTT